MHSKDKSVNINHKLEKGNKMRFLQSLKTSATSASATAATVGTVVNQFAVMTTPSVSLASQIPYIGSTLAALAPHFGPIGLRVGYYTGQAAVRLGMSPLYAQGLASAAAANPGTAVAATTFAACMAVNGLRSAYAYSVERNETKGLVSSELEGDWVNISIVNPTA